MNPEQAEALSAVSEGAVEAVIETVVVPVGEKVIDVIDNAVDNVLHKKEYETYNHHGVDVKVRKDLKGKHRDFCLCYDCAKFAPGERSQYGGCVIANAIYKNCVTYNVVSPVWECTMFEEELCK